MLRARKNILSTCLTKICQNDRRKTLAKCARVWYNRGVLIKSLVNSDIYRKISADAGAPFHAYLFYGGDRALNDNVAELFCYAVMCERHEPCFECEACRRMALGSHPDVKVIDKPAIQVDDVTGILEECQLKPMYGDYKVIFIKNADVVNEQSQNKLLKTLEEPPQNVIFVLTTDNIDKLLVTVQSRLKKIHCAMSDFGVIESDLRAMGVVGDINGDLTTILDHASNESYALMRDKVERLISALTSSAVVPKLSSTLDVAQGERKMFFATMYDYYDRMLKYASGCDVPADDFLVRAVSMYTVPALIQILPVIQQAYYRVCRNVNFGYVVDDMLYEILKVRYICKQ